MKTRNGKRFVVFLLVMLIGIAFISITSSKAGIAKTVRNTASYEQYFGESGEHRENGLLTNQIFPVSIPASADVEKFTYRHEDLMDPSDAVILVYTCDEEDYQTEIARLEELETKEEDAYGVYGITGFPYEVVAVEADNTYGIVYAMTDSEERRIIYVENTYCNYFSDINYEWYIGGKYLPEGYDAAPGNSVREAFENKD